jgi:brefeldin A-resistance guanine nucleotide exchange factor 1
METCHQGQGGGGPRFRGLAILETEVTVMTTALKRSNVWSRSDAVSAHPTLLKPFVALRSVLTSSHQTCNSLDDLDPNVFLAPFLDVIRSDVVTGHVTGLALDAVHKLLSYELLHTDMRDIANAVENLADAVTHAR